ncbi:MAG: DUF4012 domain-containing protein [Candidatus Levybacteria bacterium]|nr:DUF4012 domain-containing protein [Candidatus Levybacteria bacterium]
MEGFEKINLDSNLDSKIEKPELKKDVKINTPNFKKPGKRFPKKIIVVFLIILFLFGISVFTIILPVKKVYSSAMKTYAQVKVAWNFAKQQNIEQSSAELVKAKEDLAQTQKDLAALSYLGTIPIASGYYNDATHLMKAGSYGLDAGITMVDSIKPYVDVLGLKGKGTFVGGSAEQRIQTAIMTIGKITPRIDDVEKSMILAKKEIDAVDPNHYPSFWKGSKVKDQIITLKSSMDQGVTFISQARPLIKVLPSLLGDPKDSKYLILFQNNMELRPTGGFITAYSIFRLERGIIHVDASNDIYYLDDRIGGKPVAPAPILKYLPNVTTFNLRDSNISPDFYESMQKFESLYKKAVGGKMDVDGIIAIDTNVLVSTIKILDDQVDAAGMRFTTKTDPRCNCPQVIYALEDTISRPVNYQKSGRKDLLGALLYAIMDKALKSSPKIYWGPLMQDLITQFGQKHVIAYLYNKDAQTGLESLNAAGRIKSFDGDYLHINDTNFGGQKSNMYVKESVEQNYEVKSDGSIVKKITIKYVNPQPPSDCNLERGNLCLNATLRNWLRIYVPKGSQMIDSQGSEVKMTTYEELGKTVFDGFLTVRPEGSATFIISYRLPFKLSSGSPLPLLIQKQGGTIDNAYTININGKKLKEFPLLTDQEVKLSL